MKALVLGANGGIGSEVVKVLRERKRQVIRLTREDIDLAEFSAKALLEVKLERHKPDVIINCAGVFARNDQADFDKLFSVNVKTNWSIINYYGRNLPDKKVTFVMIGSSAAFTSRPEYALYAASKTALGNLYLSSLPLFIKSSFTIHLFNPGPVQTEMNFRDYGVPSRTIAEQILKMI